MRHPGSIAALAAAVLALASPAIAGGTLFVGHGPVGHDRSCHSPGYNSVQAAVDAASNGNTVYLCGAQFAEQVFISKTITLTGDSTSGLTAVGTAFATSTTPYPAALATDGLLVPQALLVVTGPAAHATVEGLTFSGPMPGNGGCAGEEFGILVIDGARAKLSQVTVRDIADTNPSLYGCQLGVGIQVGRAYWPKADFSAFALQNFSGTADIQGTTVDGYQKNGIAVDGPGSRARIRRSTVTGAGPAAPFGTTIAQIGIQISYGAEADLHHNTVSGNAYGGAEFASSAGVLVFGGCGGPLSADVDVHHNTLVDNDVGIYLINLNPACNGPATTPTRAGVHHNSISSVAVTNTTGFDGSIGYQAGITDIGNRDEIHHNDISGPGYAPQDPPTAFVRPIDIDSFPTTKPRIHHNTYDGRRYAP